MKIEVDLLKAICRYVFAVANDNTGYYDGHINIADLFLILGLELNEDKLQENEDIDDKMFEVCYQCNELIRKYAKQDFENVEDDMSQFNQCVRQIYRIIVENMEINEIFFQDFIKKVIL